MYYMIKGYTCIPLAWEPDVSMSSCSICFADKVWPPDKDFCPIWYELDSPITNVYLRRRDKYDDSAEKHRGGISTTTKMAASDVERSGASTTETESADWTVYLSLSAVSPVSLL